jgi:anion-transporting  ArsA/GET3 family ATPase
MADAALQLVDQVAEKALSIVDQAKAIEITDPETYTSAGMLWKAIGEMIKEVKDTFDPICEAAHKAHKAATAKRSKYLDPLTASHKSVKGLMEAYDREQERIRQAEQRRIEEEARKAEEERLLMEAIAAEEELKAQGLTAEEAKAEAEAIISQPVYVPPVVVPKAVPKMAGGPVYREIWSAEVTDIKALCRAVAMGQASHECVLANFTALNKMATALKGTLSIPGVRAVSRRV